MKIIFFVFFLITILFVACMSAPERQKDELDCCFAFRDCMYRNKDNPDKSICADFAKECRAYRRFIFCMSDNNRPVDMKFQECWDKLNSK